MINRWKKTLLQMNFGAKLLQQFNNKNKRVQSAKIPDFANN